MTSLSADRLVRAIARYGLTDDEIGSVSDACWSAVIEGIAAQRIAGHATAAAHEGALELTTPQFDELLARHEEQLALDLDIERMLVGCDALLAKASIATRVLKGPAAAHRFYADPALRSFGDGDLLVRGADIDETIDILAGAGFVRRFRAPRASFDRRFVKAVTLVGGDGLELDLHRALTPGPFGVLLDVDEIFAAPADLVRVGGRDLRCLAPELALAHACAHAALGDLDPRFVSLRDVAELLRSDVDFAGAIALFERFGIEIVAKRAVRLVEGVLGVVPTGLFADWSRDYAATRTDRWRLSSYSVSGNRYGAQAAATFWALPGVRDRVAYAYALAFPQREYLRDHRDTYARRLARSSTLVLKGRPR